MPDLEPVLPRAQSIEDLRARFEWDIPERLNLGVAICDRVADARGDAVAILDVDADGTSTAYGFETLRRWSNQFAHVLSGWVSPGDRVGVLLPQGVETALAHIAALKAGCISIPLFTLFGPDALRHRLKDAGARVLVTNKAMMPVIAQLQPDLPDLAHVVVVDDPARDLRALCAGAPNSFAAVDTAADDPALLIYTSGTTGAPKGALHGHRVLMGHLPGVEMSHDFLPQDGDRIWTPADWAWIGGLLDVLMPALYHGVSVVAHRFDKFTGEAAFELMRTHGVRNAFLPPTALKLMRQVDPSAVAPLSLRSVASGGEPLGAELIAWGQQMLGATINEFYGQTECNMIVSSCAQLAPPEPGVMGFAVPGHDVDVIDDTGAPCRAEAEGDIAVRRPNPVMFLGYWNNAPATKAKFRGDWMLTGDRGRKTRSGRIGFVGREDDVISSAGYRIGPAEVEDCLLTHPAVRLAGVVGKPDATRGHIVVAFVEIADGFSAIDDLAAEIAAHVKTRLAAYEYPREIYFIDQLPLTTTGKIIRAALRERFQGRQKLP